MTEREERPPTQERERRDCQHEREERPPTQERET